MIATLLVSAAFAAAQPGAGEAITPRMAAFEVAAAIEENFYDPAKGEGIARDLRAEAEAGRYDGLGDPREIAAALTARLSPLDGHLAVDWSPKNASAEAADAEPGAGGAEPMSWYDLMARQGHGFRGAEVLPGNIGLITMTGFAEIDFSDEDDPAWRAADAALDLVAGTDAIVFDLRSNGGGSSTMTGYLVSAFVEEGREVYNRFVYREGEESEAPQVTSDHRMTDRPVFVVVSARTGSAAESFPYTLQAVGRATVIGERTAGAANPGGQVTTESGFQVFVPDGRPINPQTGTNWEGTGVVPDIEIAAEDALRLAHEKALVAADAQSPDALWTLAALRSEAEPGPRALRRFEGTYGPYEIARKGDGLELRQGRRIPLRLRPLAEDSFFVETDPTVRFVFVREGGRIVAVERRTAHGGVRRQPRG